MSKPPKLQPIVTMPDYWVKRAMAWGADFVQHRQDHPTLTRGSQALAENGIELDAVKQGCGKLDELAVAVACGLHPAGINWGMYPDDGCDVFYQPGVGVAGLRIDVKGTDWDKHCLLWPRTKNKIFDQVNTNVLVFVQHDPPRVRLNGWVTKAFFREHHQTAGEHHFLLPDTWYLEESELWDLRDLLPSHPPGRWAWAQSISDWPSASSATGATPSSAKPSAGGAANTAT